MLWYPEQYTDGRLAANRPRRLGEGVHTTVVDGWLGGATVLREAAHSTGSILRTTLQHFGPRTQSHGVGQTEASDGPGQCAQPVNILVGCSRDDGKQRSHQVVMQFFRFAHGGTSSHPYNRSSTIIPFFEHSSSFLRQIKGVSQRGQSTLQQVLA